MAVTKQTRKDASGATVEVPSLSLDVEPVEGWTGANLPLAAGGYAFGRQAQLLKIANQISGAGWYPDDGTGTLPGNASGSSVQLASNVLQTRHASLTAIGMLLACEYSAGLWEVVRITSWTSGTYTAGTSRALTRQWPAGSVYKLLLDLRHAENYFLHGEFSVSSALVVVTPVLIPWVPDAGRIVYCPEASDVTVEATSLQTLTRETSYYNGRLRGRPARGYMGGKYYVGAPSSGSVSLWHATS